jgi:hypothetical protein
MAGLPINFAIPGESIVVTYNYTDVVSGRGILALYGAKFEDGTYCLSPNTFYPTTVATTAGNNTATDIDLDITIVRPFTISGDCIINVPLVLWNGSGGPLSPSSDVTINLYSVDGVTETALGTAVAQTISGTYAATSGGWFMISGKIAVTNKVMQSGQKIRLNIVATAPGGSGFVYVGHDPMARSGTQEGVGNWTTAQLKILIPQKMEI